LIAGWPELPIFTVYIHLMTRNKILLAMGLFCSLNVLSQNFQLNKMINGAMLLNLSCTDNSNNLYIAGEFEQTVDFDPGPGVFNLTATPSPNYYNDAFFAKYDASGNFVWAKKLSSVNREYIKSIEVDASGNVFIAGTFFGLVDFGGVSKSSGDPYYSDLFFGKYDANGNCLWVHNIGTTLSNSHDEGSTIELDASGNCYVGGIVADIGDLDPGAGTTNTIFTQPQAVFCKYTSAGAFLWGICYQNSTIVDIETNGTAVVVTGSYYNSVDFDPSASTANLTSPSGVTSHFFAEYSNTGSYIWAKSLFVDKINKIYLDAGGNVQICGGMWMGADMDPGPATAYISHTNVGFDLFMARYNSAGNYLWAKALGSDASDTGFMFDIDQNGNFYMSGELFWGNPFDFEGGPLVAYATECNDYSQQYFVGKFDSSGSPIWAEILAGSTDFLISSIASGPGDVLYIGGGVLDTADVIIGPGTMNIYNTNPLGFAPLFFTKYSAAPSTAGVPAEATALTVTEINPFQLQINFTDNSSTETGSVIQRSVSGSSWTTLDTLAANITSYTDSVNPFSVNHYTYRVQMFNASSFSCHSDTAGYTLNKFPLAANPLLLSNPSNNIMALSWSDNSSNELGFIIERNGTQIDTLAANTTSYTDSVVLVMGNSPTYRIIAYNSYGDTYGDPQNIFVNGIPNYIPNITVVSNYYANTLFLNIENDMYENGFYLERKPAGGSWSNYDTLSASGAYTFNYFDYNVVAGAYYTYRIRAFNAYGITAYSDTVGQVATLINAPQLWTVSNYAPYKATLGWYDNSSDELGFVIQRRIGSFGTWSTVDTADADMEFHQDSLGLVTGVEYYYRIYAYNASGISGYSIALNVVIQSSILPPDFVDAVPSSLDGDITFSWYDASSNETGFVIQRKAGAGSWTALDTIAAGMQTFIDSSGTFPGLYYHYRAMAINATDSSAYSPADSAMGSFAPSALVCTGYPGHIEVSWIDNSTIEDYFMVERSDDNGATWTVTGSAAADSTHFNDYIMLNDSSYYVYRVRAENYFTVSAYSDTAGALFYEPSFLQSVWPGDANQDSIANNNDVLAIGLGYGQTGIPRTISSLFWSAHNADDWGIMQTCGADMKHADCDGNGTVDNFDVSGVIQNYSMVHAFAPIVTEQRLTTADLALYPQTYSTAGNQISVDIWLGSSTAPVNGLYGIAFTIQYDATYLSFTSTSITYNDSWFGEPNVDAITIWKPLPGLMDGAMSRIDHNNASGYGKIGTFTGYLSSPIPDNTPITFSIASYLAVDANGDTLLFNTVPGTSTINSTSVSVNESSSLDVTVAPNPFTEQATISFGRYMNSADIQITDVSGKVVKNFVFSGNQLVIEREGLDAGMYFVKILSAADNTGRTIKLMIR
jgi:hypothetical protein